jgi:hypothetical protein
MWGKVTPWLALVWEFFGTCMFFQPFSFQPTGGRAGERAFKKRSRRPAKARAKPATSSGKAPKKVPPVAFAFCMFCLKELLRIVEWPFDPCDRRL